MNSIKPIALKTALILLQKAIKAQDVNFSFY